MSDVSVIGLGNMGSALTQTFLDAGYEVTVWNRTKSKATELLDQGAILADDLASAVQASPRFIVCLLNYEVTDRLIFESQVSEALPGKTMIQMSNGTPQDARRSEHLAHRYGADFLCGDIEVYPENIGNPDATIFIAGKKSLYVECEPILKTLAGNTTYLGEQIGAPLAYGYAIGSVLYSALLGILHAARICEVEGINLQDFIRGMETSTLESINSAVLDLLERIRDNRFEESQATIKIYADSAEQLLKHAHETETNPSIPRFIDEILKKAIDSGFGDKDLAAIIKILGNGKG